MTTASKPAWLSAARAKLGTREAASEANSPTIMGWTKTLGAKVLGIVYNADHVLWCGLSYSPRGSASAGGGDKVVPSNADAAPAGR
jgi:hypothetical protein